MNEELKIIIKAVTDNAKKGINGVKKELDELQKNGKGASGSITASFKAIGKSALIAVTAVMAVTTALVALGKNSIPYIKEQAKLIAGFQSAGASAEQASKTFEQVFRFLGESDRAVEASNHLAKLTTNEKELAEWTKALQGVYATFGDSLPIEALAESSNETARVGKVTGNLADALNWAGVSEDALNAKLATTNSLEERQTIIRQTLNGLYNEASEIYERNNKALLDYNESQARVQSSMASAGASMIPLMTAINNLGSALFTALKPALDVIVPVLAQFVNWITQGIQAVTSFFSAITGKSTAVKSISNIGKNAVSATKGLNSATQGANGLSSGLDNTAKSAEKAKKMTAGFDELNIIGSGSSSSGGSGSGSGGGSGAGTPSYATGGVGGLVDPVSFETEVTETENVAGGFVSKLKNIFSGLKETFAPSIEAWTGAIDTMKTALNDALPSFQNGFNSITSGLSNVGGYVIGTFVPNVVNSFSTNLVPILADVAGFSIKNIGTAFEEVGTIFESVSNNIIVPAIQVIEGVITGIFDTIGQVWAEHGEPFLTELQGVIDSVMGVISDLYYNFIEPIAQSVIETVNRIWNETLQPLVKHFMDAVMEIGVCIMDLYNTIIAPVVDWIMKNIVPIITNAVKKIIEVVEKITKPVAKVINGVIDVLKGVVQFITGVFTLDWKRAWEGIKNVFSGVWDIITGIAKTAWETIKGIFSVVGEFFGGIWRLICDVFKSVDTWFSNQFKKAWEGIKGAFAKTGEFFGNAWNGIKGAFSKTGEYFSKTFSGAWENTKKAFSGVSSFFSGVWNNIKSIFSNVGTAIASGIKGAVTSAVNSVLSSAVKIINGFISAINFAIDIINAIPGVNIKSLKKLSVPKMAKGGIVDSATLAVIGEQGKEAVVPLENNTEWINKLAETLASKLSAPSRIVLMVDGKELGWASINGINGITKQTGNLQLTLA